MNTATLEKTKEGIGGIEPEAVNEEENASPAVRKTLGLRRMVDEKINKGKNRIYTERMTVTPAIAQIMLARNKDNRKIRPAKLAQLKSDITHKRFELNGEPIIFAKTGELNDGQHRLQAIVEANVATDMLVTYGVERSTRKTIDTGVSRTTGDVLTMGGTPYGNSIAQLARMTIGYERTGKTALGRVNTISPSEIYHRANVDSVLQECAAYSQTARNKFARFAKASIIAFAYYRFIEASGSQAKAKTFMELFREGRDLKSDSPVYFLREYLSTRPKLTSMDKLECIIKAWNAWIKDTEIKQFKISGTLPKIEG